MRRHSRMVPGVLLMGLACAVAFLPAGAEGQGPTPPKSQRMPRMYPGAPPFVPHEVESRKALCQECHTTGVDGAPISPHPTRTHFCVACHVPQDRSAPPFPAPQR